jgi:TetR/AcrR family transcriptional repressor of nem operon
MMARKIKEEDYAARRKEILDVTQRLVMLTKGYEQMTIQDILDELHISKGAFYHYFDSKEALLETLIERLIDEAERVINPIVYDPDLPAMDKLHRYFDTAARWKTAQKAYMLALLRVWYTDDNALVRQKVWVEGKKRITPMLTLIIRQGIQEGVMATPFPGQVSETIYSLFQSLGDTFTELLLSGEPNRDALSRAETAVAVYMDAVERILRLSPGSLHLIDTATLVEWFPPDDSPLIHAVEKMPQAIGVSGS